jgi:hypothetical protein
MPPKSPYDEPNDEVRQEKLDQDYDTPFGVPDTQTPAAQPGDSDIADSPDHTNDDDTGALGADHPSTDTNIQAEELYDEGIAGAAEAGEPNAESDVLGYDPNQDVRRKNSDSNPS